jgi:uncharacterized metal-binding protein YceD (DUF177 family)
MDALAPFRIPVATLNSDEASYQWELGPDFLAIFDDEHEPLSGVFSVQMEFHRSGGISTLDFMVSGTVNTVCDRCLSAIEMPVKADYHMIIKFGNPAESTDEVVFIDAESPNLNVGQHIYDFILLSIPISQRIPDCETMENSPCDTSVLSYLSTLLLSENPEGGKDDSPWDELKKVTDN